MDETLMKNIETDHEIHKILFSKSNELSDYSDTFDLSKLEDDEDFRLNHGIICRHSEASWINGWLAILLDKNINNVKNEL